VNLYHAWFNLKDGVGDIEFTDAARGYLGHLKENGLIAGFRITRRMLGLAPPPLKDWHIIIEFENLTQMDSAFGQVSARADPIEGFHHALNSKVQDVFFALYRDFPDGNRVTGQERF
jgi:hypothetical protein